MEHALGTWSLGFHVALVTSLPPLDRFLVTLVALSPAPSACPASLLQLPPGDHYYSLPEENNGREGQKSFPTFCGAGSPVGKMAVVLPGSWSCSDHNERQHVREPAAVLA